MCVAPKNCRGIANVAGRPIALVALTAFSLQCLWGTALASDHAPAADTHASSGGHGDKKKAALEEPVLPVPSEADKPIADQYCASVQGEAEAAKLYLQRKELKKAQEALDQGAKKVEAKIEELKSWMKRREDFLSQAKDNLTAIYSKMPPEAAASRFLAMNETVAAAILSKLPPKGASAILAEMESVKAARLSSLLAGAADVAEKTTSASPPQAKGAP